MSEFSGKCDVRDFIAGFAGWYDRDGNPASIGSGAGCLYSDEMQDFIAFKKATGGVLHQHRVLVVQPWDYEDVEKLTDGKFKAIEHKRIVPDKRSKTGQREETYYTYKYYDKEYQTLKELNKHKVYITIDIHFDTLLDLIPYYPYLVCSACSSDGQCTIYISQESYVDEELADHLEHGWYSKMWVHYKRDLQRHYQDVVLKYFNPEGREEVEEVTFSKVENDDGSYLYIGKVKNSIDENFEPKWRWADGKTQSHWTSPKISNAKDGLIIMSREDYETYMGDTALVYYVKAKNYPLNLN